MKVTLLTYSDLSEVEELINGNDELKHTSLTFKAEGVSFVLIQELSKHKTLVITYKSLLTLTKELASEEEFDLFTVDNPNIDNYLYRPNDTSIKAAEILALENTRKFAALDKNLEDVIYSIPFGFKTDMVFTVKGENLKKYLMKYENCKLDELRVLFEEIFEQLPSYLKILVK